MKEEENRMGGNQVESRVKKDRREGVEEENLLI